MAASARSRQLVVTIILFFSTSLRLIQRLTPPSEGPQTLLKQINRPMRTFTMCGSTLLTTPSISNPAPSFPPNASSNSGSSRSVPTSQPVLLFHSQEWVKPVQQQLSHRRLSKIFVAAMQPSLEQVRVVGA